MENKSIQLSNSNFSGNIVQGDVQGNVEANPVSDNSHHQSNQYSSKDEKTLVDAAKAIQKLIHQLEADEPAATYDEIVAYVDDETTPGFKRRVVGALKAAGETAIEEVLDNPYVNITKDCIKGWMNPG